MSVTPPEVIGAHRDHDLSDRDILDDHSLQQERLRGSLSRGPDWRRRSDPGILKRLVASALLAALAIGVVAVVGFMQKQLELKKKQEKQQQQQVNPSPSKSSAPAHSKGHPKTGRTSPTSTHGVPPRPSHPTR